MSRTRTLLSSLSSRRDFLRAASASSVALAALACGGPGTNSSDGGQNEAADGGDTPLGDDAGTLDPTCGELTEPNIEGPFFSPGSPERTSLREPDMSGVLFLLEGKVLSVACEPIDGATLDFWQANDEGAYDNEAFVLRGHQRADLESGYILETIVPGHYLNGASYRPAHIHVMVSAPGFLTLTTQLYFADDPYNEIDPFIRSSLIMDWREGRDGERQATFDFVLARA